MVNLYSYSMRGLSSKEKDDAVAFLNLIREEMAPLIVTPRELTYIKSLLETAPKTHPLSRPLDPDFNDIRPSESFGVTLDYAGEPVACVCARSIETRDFVSEWITTYRLFGNRVPRMEFEPFEYVGHPPRIHGIVGYGGGSWVHPDWRGMNLASVTSRLGKLFALLHLGVDFYVALIKDHRDSWAKVGLDWPRGKKFTRGHHPGRENWEQDVGIYYMDRDHIIDMFQSPAPVRAVGQKLRLRLEAGSLGERLRGDNVSPIRR